MYALRGKQEAQVFLIINRNLHAKINTMFTMQHTILPRNILRYFVHLYILGVSDMWSARAFLVWQLIGSATNDSIRPTTSSVLRHIVNRFPLGHMPLFEVVFLDLAPEKRSGTLTLKSVSVFRVAFSVSWCYSACWTRLKLGINRIPRCCKCERQQQTTMFSAFCPEIRLYEALQCSTVCKSLPGDILRC